MPAHIKRLILLATMTIGIGLVVLAVFAYALGIDNNADWGASRIVMLAAGLLLVVKAVILFRLKPGVLSGWWFGPYATLRVAASDRRAGCNAALSGVLIILLMTGGFFWYVSRGSWSLAEWGTLYYSSQAEAFLNGQLHLLVEPTPELLALDNPYDVQQRQSVPHVHDVSLYEGKYYIYWGPVPALVSAGWKLITGWPLNDAHLVLMFYVLSQAAMQWLLRQAWQRFFPEVHWLYQPLLYLIFALNAPLAFVFGRASVYEAAILGGQAFLLLGAAALWQSVQSGRTGWVWLTAFAFALAVGCRNSLVFAAGILLLAYLIALRREHGMSTAARGLLAAAIPLGLGAVLLAWFNAARFGSIAEPGMRYALTVVNFLEEYPYIVLPRYLLPNLYLFLFMPPAASLPFELHWITEASFPFFIRLPEHYYFSEPVVGLLWTMPFVFFSLISAALWFTRTWPFQRQLKQQPCEQRFLSVQTVVLLAGIAEFIFICLFFAPMMRYLLDASFLLMLAAATGWLYAISKLNSTHAGVLVKGLGTVLVVYSIWAGWLFISASHAIYYGS